MQEGKGRRVSEIEQLEVDRFRIDISRDELDRFHESPDEYLTNIVRDSGLLDRINSLRFRGALDIVEKDGGVQCYHIRSPEAEKSNTVCF